MYYLLLIFYFLSSPILATPKTESIVLLLDQVNETHSYWQRMALQKDYGYLKRPPHTWFSPSWKKETKMHLQALTAKRSELASFLGRQLSCPKSCTAQEYRLLHKNCKMSLKEHGIPSHLAKNWFPYSLTAASVAILSMYVIHFYNTRTLFIIDPKVEVKSPLDANSKLTAYDYVKKEDGWQYIQTKKTNAQNVKDLLVTRGIEFSEQRADLSLGLYDETGRNIIAKLIDEHGVQPARDIFKTLRNENATDLPIFSTDVKHDQEQLEKRLTECLKKAAMVEQTADLVKKYLKNRSVDDLLLEEKKNLNVALFAKIGEIFPREIENALKEVHELSLKIKSLTEAGVRPDADVIPHLGEDLKWRVSALLASSESINAAIKNATVELKPNLNGYEIIPEAIVDFLKNVGANRDFIGLAVEMISVRLYERDLQISAALHKGKTVADQARLNLAISATIPLIIVSFFGYKASTTLYNTIHTSRFINPFKRDLICLSLLLNKERFCRNTQELSHEYNGMVFYWISRLDRYTSRMSTAHRNSYKQYLDELKNPSLLPEQKSAVIECIFKEYTFLH